MSEKKEDKKESKEDITQEVIDKNTEILAKIEAANAKSEELLTKHSEQQATIAVSGEAEAGIAPPVVDPEEADRERINSILKETGLHI